VDTTLIVTDITRMSGARVCVAGVNEEGRTIRPVFEHGGIMEDWLYEKGKCTVRPFAKITLNLIENRPQPPHTEDWVIRGEKICPCMMLGLNERRILLQKICDPSVAEIFGAEVHHDQGHFILSGEGKRSLGTIRVHTVQDLKHSCYNGKWDYRLSFEDSAGGTYRLAITDLALRYYVDYLRQQEMLTCEEIEKQLTKQFRGSAMFLRIGLARGWEKFPDRCYLQITGIYNFPDYLSGKCFADYRPQPDNEEDVPF
jgi:hypothetical protein